MRKYGIQGHGTITEWRRKYGIFDIDNSFQNQNMQVLNKNKGTRATYSALGAEKVLV